jgi:dodecin
MSTVKVITIIGSSPESFAKAADNAVRTAQKTIRNIKGVDVITMSATVDPNPGGIKEYRTTVNIAFVLEES